MPARQFDLLIRVGLFLLCTATVWADEAPPFAPEKVAAVATDETAPIPDAEAVAQEILKLQEQMGGSIVSRMEPMPAVAPSPMPAPYRAPAPFPPVAAATSPRPAFGSPIVALREIAWQLEQSAYWLESLDLYEQADALRATADRLRKDAREMKAEMGATGAK